MENPSTPETVPRALFEVTEKAARRIRTLLTEKKAQALRVKVTAGGCSGFSYNLDLWSGPAPEGDHRVPVEGGAVLVDKKSLLYLAGTTLDFEETPFARKFIFKNPNASARCSCGESFGV